ncbi:MAG: transglutaminase domain-containing protein [Epulopiscium sp.]|nr:transglutaminase domain-containing protein [Candidatus Epulonipiscium sp.]
MVQKKISEILINFLLIAIMSFSIVYMVVADMGFSPIAISLIKIIIIVYLVCSIICINKKSFYLSLLVLLLSLVAGMFYIYKGQKIEIIIEGTRRFFIWLNDYKDGFVPVNWTYAKVITIIICIAITFLIYIFTKKNWNYLWIASIGSGYFLFLWYRDYMKSQWTLYLFLFSCLLYYFKHSFYKFNKYIDENDPMYFLKFMSWGWILSIVIFSISFYYSNNHIVNMEWVDRIIGKIAAKTVYYYAEDYFSVASAGLGEDDGYLGGDINLSDLLVLKVTAPEKTYLTAAVKEIYTGHSWINLDNEATTGRSWERIYFDSFETKEGIYELVGGDYDIYKYFDNQKITIKYNNIITKSLFMPQRAYKLGFNSIRHPKIMTDKGGVLSLNEAETKGFSYSVDLYKSKQKDEDFIKLMRKSKKNLYKDNYREIIKSREGDKNRKEILRRLIDRAEEVNERYLFLPDTLPKRVKDTAKEITKGEKNNYDKVKAIEKYFAKGYVYTLTPGENPEGWDFVDYFLFESRRGYCTYYATAMTVLVRALGIPARYVEGYIVSEDNEKEGDTYLITNKQAHAWTEVYFEGIGWIIFEPTPSLQMEYSLPINDALYDLYYPKEYIEYLMGQHSNTDIEIDDFKKEENEKRNYINFYGFIGIGISFIILFNRIKYYWKRLSILRMNGKRTAIMIYDEYLKIGKLLKYPMKDTETPLQYSDRMDKIFGDKTITQLFIKARYSQYDLNEEEKKIMHLFYRKLLKDIKERKGKLKFFIFRYLLGKI